MPQSHRLVGTGMPVVRLGEMVNDQLRAVRASDIFGRGASVVVGMPGAFTPLCTEKHLPNLISNADRLRASGFTEIACVATSDPYSIDAWARAIDPARKVRFLSDGNLNLVRALGLTTHATRLFLGECSERYLLTVRDGVIASVRVEDEITNFSCTRTDDLVLEEV